MMGAEREGFFVPTHGRAVFCGFFFKAVDCRLHLGACSCLLMRHGLHERTGAHQRWVTTSRCDQGEDPTPMAKVFSKNFLEQDTTLIPLLTDHTAFFSYDHSADVGFMLIMPWNNSVTLEVTEESKTYELNCM